MKRLSVLFLSNNNPFGTKGHGGAESAMRAIARGLADLGHSCWYLCPTVSDGDRAVATREGLHLLTVPTVRGARFFILRYLSHKAPQLTALAIAIFGKVNVIYCYAEEHSLSVAKFVKRFSPYRPRIILRVANYSFIKHARRCDDKGWLWSKLINRVDAFNFISEKSKLEIEEKIKDTRLTIDRPYNFVLDIGTVPCVNNVEIKPAKGRERVFKLAMAARLSKTQKRQDILLMALKKISCQYQVHLDIFGCGENEKDLLLLCRDLGIENRVTFRGFVSQNDLWDHLRDVDLFCHATDWETQGQAVLEAMAFGVPVLVSDVAVCNTHVIDGKTGYLASNDPQLWAEKITYIMENDSNTKNITQSAQIYVRKNFDQEVNRVKYEKVLLRILGE